MPKVGDLKENPTSNFTHNDAFGSIDRDSEIGTGSTDLLLGGFHRGNLTKNNMWTWYGQAQLDLPVLEQDQYLPGIEISAAAEIYYNGWSLGGIQIMPSGADNCLRTHQRQR